jgi:hypothetical protein
LWPALRRLCFCSKRRTLFVLSGLDVDRDVGKTKKAVRKSEALEGNQAAKKNEALEGNQAAKKNEAVEQRVEKDAETAEGNGSVTKKRKKKRPVRCIQQHTDVEFRREFPKVFRVLVKKAKQGGTAETRLLLQIGKFGDPKVAKRRGAKSLSEMLLDELKRRQDECEAAADRTKAEAQIAVAVTNEASSEGATSGGDAENG